MNDDSSQEKAKREIFRGLFSRRYSPGERLIENKLANDLQISRTPIRLALGELVQNGLLDRKDNGCYVPQISGEDMLLVFEARASLEGQAAYWAATRGNDERLKKIQDLVLQEEVLYLDPEFQEKYTEVNYQFHRNIAQAPGNPYLARYIDQIYWRSQIFVFFFDRFYRKGYIGSDPRDTRTSISFGEHEKLASAIVARDSALAKALMEKHILSTYQQSIGR
ncbi:MAG: GntR family transcriptional regulator [Treponema sp.]|nr:GntR family transcriptional regulator [Treponema sp.]